MAAEVAVEERSSKGWVEAVCKDEEIVGGWWAAAVGRQAGRRNPLGAIIGFTASVGLVPLPRLTSVPFILSKLVKMATNIIDSTFPPIDENV